MHVFQVAGKSEAGKPEAAHATPYFVSCSTAYGGHSASMPSSAMDVEAGAPVDPGQPDLHEELLIDEHMNYSRRAPLLRASVLGATDGLVSVAALMLGVGAGTDQLHALVLAGLAGLVGGALSMACGEFISVSSQRCDTQPDMPCVMHSLGCVRL